MAYYLQIIRGINFGKDSADLIESDQLILVCFTVDQLKPVQN